jgi:hypothetical protein
MATKKKLTLAQTWTKCLAMWRWIAKQSQDSDFLDDEMKRQWLRKHHEYAGPYHCFFCYYSAVGRERMMVCANCPGVLVDRSFDCMWGKADYRKQPVAFYKQLVELNNKRLAANKEKRCSQRKGSTK